VAINNVSLALREGTCTGLVGPNGAGKTTLLEMIEGLRKPDEGQISIFGQVRNLPDRSLLSKIGVGSQTFAQPSRLTVAELFDLYASLYETAWDPKELITLMGLQEKSNVYFSRLSGGQKKRASVALALIGDPSLLILDEPTGELDPQARRLIWDLIKKKRGASRTVLLATHQMEEVASICDEVIVLDHGKILDSGSPDYLISKHCPEHRLIFETKIQFDPNQLGIPQIKTKINTERQVMVAEAILSNFEAAFQAMDRVRKVGADAITSFSVQRMTLEDVFIKLTGRVLKE